MLGKKLYHFVLCVSYTESACIVIGSTLPSCLSRFCCSNWAVTRQKQARISNAGLATIFSSFLAFSSGPRNSKFHRGGKNREPKDRIGAG